jgi:type I restriction enzyme R subunit
MQKVLSARDRLEKIVADILLDMETRDRLKSGHGNALLVSGSIYSACRFFEMFQQTDLAGRCAIVTSYRPSPSDIKGEESGEGLTERLRQYEIYRRMLAAHFNEPEDTAMYKVEPFEQAVKKRFIDEPGQMKLLIVVDKLLTGFDAPPATYLYIDKPMQDHGLFQAICRVNRLDGEDKEYGYIIDYKDLFRSLEQSIKDYTGEAFAAYDKADVEGLLKDRLSQGRERLEEVREAIKALCEPVAPPRDTAAYLLDERMQLQVKVADTAADVAELTTLAVDDAIRRVKKADWRGNRFKEREVRNAIKAVLRDDALVDSILAIVMNRNS